MTEPPVSIAVFRRRGAARWPWVLAGVVAIFAGAGIGAVLVLTGAAGAGAPSASAPVASASASPSPAPSETETASATASQAPAPPPAASAEPSASPPAPAAAARPDEAAAVFRDRVAAPLRVSRYADAVEGLEAAVALDPELRSCVAVDHTLIELAVRAIAMGGDTERRFLELLTERAGARGIDVLLEVVVTRGGSKASARASEILAREDVRARGSAALRIAYDLRAARDCSARKALLERAGQDGDARAMRELGEAAAACADIAIAAEYHQARRAILERTH